MTRSKVGIKTGKFLLFDPLWRPGAIGRSIGAGNDNGVAVRIAYPAFPVIRTAVTGRRIAMGWLMISAFISTARATAEPTFVTRLYRRQMKAITYLGKIEKILGVAATTRSWSTIEKVANILRQDSQDAKGF
jgi:hypothetical protein